MKYHIECRPVTHDEDFALRFYMEYWRIPLALKDPFSYNQLLALYMLVGFLYHTVNQSPASNYKVTSEDLIFFISVSEKHPETA